MNFLKILGALLVCYCNFVSAQFLPDNTTLNMQSVQRWMDSNRDMSAIIQAVDAMHTSDLAIQAFDELPGAEQDQEIAQFLEQKNLATKANTIITQHGWKSVGEYMRLSAKLGNAIAAYFLVDSMKGLNTVQQKALRDKAEPAVLAVPASDINFVIANEKLLKSYIQAYSQGG